MLLIQSALEAPLPCTKTTIGGPVSAGCCWRRGGCCWASAIAGASAAAPPSRARLVIRDVTDALFLPHAFWPPTLAKAGRRRYARFMTICFVMSPVRRLAVEADHGAVTGVRWASPSERTGDTESNPLLEEAARQLGRYFAKKLKRFDLPLAAPGTDFQQRVWAAMRDIPYGETTTYGGLAM